MKYLDRLAVEAAERKGFTAREVILMGCLFPLLPLMATFAGPHPLLHCFSDPASDRAGCYLNIGIVSLFYIGAAAYWAWAVRWFIRRHRERISDGGSSAGAV